jgi:hypothetical protein
LREEAGAAVARSAQPHCHRWQHAQTPRSRGLFHARCALCHWKHAGLLRVLRLSGGGHQGVVDDEVGACAASAADAGADADADKTLRKAMSLGIVLVVVHLHLLGFTVLGPILPVRRHSSQACPECRAGAVVCVASLPDENALPGVGGALQPPRRQGGVPHGGVPSRHVRRSVRVAQTQRYHRSQAGAVPYARRRRPRLRSAGVPPLDCAISVELMC